jgi:hypothetical protein
MNKKKERIIIALIFLVGIIFSAYLLSRNVSNDNSESHIIPVLEPEVANDSALYFKSSQKSVSVDEDFTLDAMINPGGNQVSAVTLHFTFDQTKLRLDEIISSDKFSLILFDAKIDNTDGTASIDVAVPTANLSISEISKIVTLNFHALDSVINSLIDYTPASQVAADGEIGDVVKTREKVLVTVD